MVDQTGIGRPVVDLLCGAGIAPVAVTIHGGDEVIRVREGEYRVPKRTLIGAVQAALAGTAISAERRRRRAA